jgi:chromosome segregation ATPase
MRVLTLLTVLTLPVAALLKQGTAAAEDGEVNPVSKIVKLLKDMQTRLTEEAETDETIYEKMTCFCEVTEKEKKASIAAAEATIDESTAAIEENSALSAQLKTEIENLKSEMAKAQDAIDEATGLRESEREEFEAENKELLETIDALDRALEVLGKHQSFLEVKKQLQRLKRVKSAEMQRVSALIQQPAGYKSYNSRSGEIFGILSQMKETFEQNHNTTLTEEARSQAMFEDLVAEKKHGIEVARERKNTKVMELSEAEVALVNAKHALKDARETLSADQKFLVDLMEKCAVTEKEYKERKASRQEEIVAIGEALSILTGDAARDLFTGTLGFTQLAEKKAVSASLAERAVRAQLVDELKAAAKKSGSAQIAMLAVSAKLDAFTKVKAAIDEMLVELKKQQQDEFEHKEWCNKELRSNSLTHKKKTYKAEDLTKANNVLADTIETLDQEIESLEMAVAEAKKIIKRASEDREAANKEFQQTVADQNASVQILKKVLVRLQKVYQPDALTTTPTPMPRAMAEAKIAAGTALLQKARQPEGINPDGGFQKGYQQQSSGGVLGLIEMTIADAERLKMESIAAEQDQQAEYNKLVKDTSDEITADNLSIADKSEAKATAETEKQEVESSLQGTETEIADLEKFATELHASCDFVLDNFNLRQEARAAEMDALENAKAILSGADFK